MNLPTAAIQGGYGHHVSVFDYDEGGGGAWQGHLAGVSIARRRSSSQPRPMRVVTRQTTPPPGQPEIDPLQEDYKD